MPPNLLSDEVRIFQAIGITAGAAGLTPLNGNVIDMAGFDGVLFIVQLGTIAPGAVTSLKVQEDSSVAMGAAADLAGTGQTILDTDDDTVRYIDVKRPLKQFLRLVVSRGTANATVAAMALLYRPRSKPPTHGAGVTGEKWPTPAEG